MIEFMFELLAMLISIVVIGLVVSVLVGLLFITGYFVGWLLLPVIPLEPKLIGILFVVAGLFFEFRNY